jgi:putative tricarboxylic transport membrane protein
MRVLNDTHRRRLRRVGIAGAAVALGASVAACGSTGSSGSGDAADFPTQTVEIMVPAAAGGGWDSTARAMQKVIENDKIIDEPVEVFNVEGGGGATGLSQLQGDKGNPHHLMMTGLVMIGALGQANSPVSLEDTTPLATLTEEAEAFVVPKNSKFTTINDVVKAFKADPTKVTFGGGSAGGSDHLVVGELIAAADGDPSEIKYVGYSGGGEATAGILSGDVEVGVSGVSEFEAQIKSGDMRLLAVSTADPLKVAGKPAPSLKSAGYDVDFSNWRAIVGPPELSKSQSAAATKMLEQVHSSAGWRAALKKNGWTDFFQTGAKAQQFIADETKRVDTLSKELGL